MFNIYTHICTPKMDMNPLRQVVFPKPRLYSY